MVVSVVALLVAAPVQDTGLRPNTASYADARTAELVSNARAARERNERLVTGYTASVSQRIGVGIRALSRDRMLYRQELTAKIGWKRDGQSRIEVLGAREGIPVVYRRDQVPEDLDDNLRSLVVNPAEDYLRVIGMDEDNDGFVYPLREGGERDYRFEAGDSTIITLPTGKRIRLLELRILPKRSDWRLISGSLWFDADTYGLVRAVFRPARPFELQRDLEPDDKDDVPSWVNATGEVKFVTLEYGLYENRWWMLRYTALDALGTMGSWLGMPIRMERIYSDYEVEGGTPPDPNSKFRPAGTWRRRPDSTEAGLDSVARKIRRDSIGRVVDACVKAATDSSNMRTRAGRVDFRRRMRQCTGYHADEDSALVVVIPDDTVSLVKSPTLGQPILQMGDLITESELKGLADAIGGLPKRPWAASLQLPRGVGAVLQRARYNRVEALSLGVGGKADFGRLVVDGQARIGFADGWPNVELGLSSGSRARLAGYRRLAAANPDTRPFGVVNSVFGLLAHRDDGEYFRAQGAELVLHDPGSGWWNLRAYAEHQTSARVETSFSIPKIFGSDAHFRPNILADRADQLGLALTLRGDKPISRSFTLSGEAAFEGATGDFEFGRGQATLRGLVTPGGPLAVAVAASAGTSTGTLPIQSRFFLGGPATLRGYDGGVTSGAAFWTGRVEVANSFPAARISAFSDIGWAGPRDSFSTGKPLMSVGVGSSFLDGLVRMDLARGLRGPKGWRFDLYFDGVL